MLLLQGLPQLMECPIFLQARRKASMDAKDDAKGAPREEDESKGGQEQAEGKLPDPDLKVGLTSMNALFDCLEQH
jgi:hypothetical protein